MNQVILFFNFLEKKICSTFLVLILVPETWNSGNYYTLAF